MKAIIPKMKRNSVFACDSIKNHNRLPQCITSCLKFSSINPLSWHLMQLKWLILKWSIYIKSDCLLLFESLLKQQQQQSTWSGNSLKKMNSICFPSSCQFNQNCMIFEISFTSTHFNFQTHNRYLRSTFFNSLFMSCFGHSEDIQIVNPESFDLLIGE